MSERTQRSKAAEEREKRVEEMRQGLKLENGKSRLELLEVSILFDDHLNSLIHFFVILLVG